MRASLVVSSLLLFCACGPPPVSGGGGSGGGSGGGGADAGPALASPGCGQASDLASGGVQLTMETGSEGGGARGYYLSLPENYDPDQPHALVFGYAGTSWLGHQIQPYLNLEEGSVQTIHVYPDVLWRDFEGWGNMGGWLLGEHAQPAHGMEDLVFTEQLIDHLSETYCIDTGRVFATGHS